MQTIQGTKTAENLRAALAGESIARNKYTFFAMAARKEGLDEIANAFERLANNEMMHAKFWFETLYGKSEKTSDNLLTAARGEYSEWHDMYPGFAAQARADGLEDIAVMFERVAAIEFDHDRQFMSLCAKLVSTQAEAAQMPPQPITESRPGYRCQFCGAVFESRPAVCGVCKAIGSFENCTIQVAVNE